MKRISRNFFARQSLRSIRLFSLFVLSIMLLVILMAGQSGALKVQAQDDPLETPPEAPEAAALKTDRNVYTEPALPALPAAGGKFLDPKFGTQILRATDETDGQNLGTFYPHWPTFNTDNTYILIRKEGGTARIKPFNKTTFTVSPALLDPPLIDLGGGQFMSANFESAIWHPTNPRLIYCFPIYYQSGGKGMRLYTYDVVARVYTLVKDFASLSGGNDYLHQMSMSSDGNVFAWSHVRDSDTNIVYYLVWRKSDNLVVHKPDTNNIINEVRLDKTGKWLFIPYNSGLNGIGSQLLNVNSCPNPCQVINVDQDSVGGHGDLGIETIVSVDPDIAAIDWHPLPNADALEHKFWYETIAGVRDFSEGTHLSLLADNEDWALVSTYSDTSNPPPFLDSHIFENEIFQIALDGSHRVRRICHSRTNWIHPDYWATPRANISKDGRFVAFTSNWEVSGGRTDLFIARIEPAPEGAPPLDTRINAGGGRYYPPNRPYWESDSHEQGGDSAAPSNVSSTDILNTTDDVLYRSERYGTTFGYNIPVQSSGSYTVRLHFAEIYWCVGTNPCPNNGSGPGKGARVFNVNVEGSPVLSNYDITAKVGKLKAVVEQVQTTVTDGTLNINFTTIADNAKISAIEVIAPSGGAGDVVWTNLVGVTANGNDLTKTSTTAGWNAGATATQTLSGDGYVEFSTAENDTGKMCGLSHTSANQTYTEIDYAISLGGGNLLRVYENGLLKAGFGNYTPGQRFRVAVEGGVVKYYRDGMLFYTSTVAPTYPLLVDTSIYDTGATITDAVIKQHVDWTNLVGVTANGNDLTKTSTTAGWNAGAISSQTLSGDGSVEFSVGENDTGKMCGLSHTSANQTFTEIDYALSLGGAGVVRVYENGTLKSSFGSYVPGDKFIVAVEGGVVKYYKNDVLLYTSTIAPTYPLLVDTSLYHTGTTITDAVIAGAWSN